MIFGNYFLLQYPKDKFKEIVFNKTFTYKWDKKLFEKMIQNRKMYEKKHGTDSFLEKRKKEMHAFLFDFKPFYQGLYQLTDHATVLRIGHIIKNPKNKTDCCELMDFDTSHEYTKNEVKNRKFPKIMSNMISGMAREELNTSNYCNALDQLYESYLALIDKLYDYLNLHGNFYFGYFFQPCDQKCVEIIYLLSLLFGNVIILNGMEFYCIGYLGEFGLKREEMNKIRQSKNFQIIPKPELSELTKYYQKIIKNEIERMKYVQEDKKDKYIPLWIQKAINDVLYKEYQSRYFNQFIIRLETVFDIKIDEKVLYKHLMKELKDPVRQLSMILKKKVEKNKKEQNILEIGMGLGFFTKVICKSIEKLPKTKLIVCDPEEIIVWEKQGIRYVDSLYKDKYQLIEEDPLTLLPKMIKQYGDSYFDFILLHKSYVYDRMISYLQHIQNLLKIGGQLVIPIVINISDLEVISFIKKNYQFMKYSSNRYFYIFEKIKNDDRH